MDGGVRMDGDVRMDGGGQVKYVDYADEMWAQLQLLRAAESR